MQRNRACGATARQVQRSRSNRKMYQNAPGSNLHSSKGRHTSLRLRRQHISQQLRATIKTDRSQRPAVASEIWQRIRNLLRNDRANQRMLSRFPVGDALWLVCPILMYWLARALIMAHRRMMDDDPIFSPSATGTAYWPSPSLPPSVLAGTGIGVSVKYAFEKHWTFLNEYLTATAKCVGADVGRAIGKWMKYLLQHALRARMKASCSRSPAGRYPTIATELLTPTNRKEVVGTVRAAGGVVTRCVRRCGGWHPRRRCRCSASIA